MSDETAFTEIEREKNTFYIKDEEKPLIVNNIK